MTHLESYKSEISISENYRDSQSGPNNLQRGSYEPAAILQIHYINVFDKDRNPAYFPPLFKFLTEKLSLPGKRYTCRYIPPSIRFWYRKIGGIIEPWHVISNNKCWLRRACTASFKLRNSKWCSVSSLTVIEYSNDLQRLWSDCAYAQAGLSLCWSHTLHCWKSYATAHII